MTITLEEINNQIIICEKKINDLRELKKEYESNIDSYHSKQIAKYIFENKGTFFNDIIDTVGCDTLGWIINCKGITEFIKTLFKNSEYLYSDKNTIHIYEEKFSPSDYVDEIKKNYYSYFKQ